MLDNPPPDLRTCMAISEHIELARELRAEWWALINQYGDEGPSHVWKRFWSKVAMSPLKYLAHDNKSPYIPLANWFMHTKEEQDG